MKFKELHTNDYFQFESDKDSIYRKISAGRIRKLGEHGIIRYFKNEEVIFFGDDISQFIKPIHVKARKAASNK